MRARAVTSSVLAAFVAVLVGATAGCDAGTPLERSCEGEVVAGCRGHQYVALKAFTVDPTSVQRDDVFADLNVHAEIERCSGDTATMVGIRVEAEYTADGAPRVLPLFSLPDDGANGDPTPGDGVVDRAVENPFTGLVPTGPLELRGRAYSPSCEGEEVVSIDFQLLPEPR